jgi:RNA polymerase sigma-70 factor (ECF subfamily)
MQHFSLELHLNTRKDKDNPSDRLIKACLQGDRKAQRKLYEQLAPKMFPVCLRYMNNREQAEDVLQDGFVTLFSKLDSYSGTGSFEGWARKIFVNTALMQLRRNDVLKESDDLDGAWDIGSPEPSAIQDIGYKELMELIGELPPGFRTVFNMYVIEGYSHKEIAEELGISENTSRSQLQRARVILQKKILEKQG